MMVVGMLWLGLGLVAAVQGLSATEEVRQPNIILILADDLGWNDVSWHNQDMPTPRMERLAKEGVILEQNYMQQVCTPSRAALLTGRYPFHIGRQKRALKPLQPTGLHLNLTTLPQELNKLGYQTHMIGKWHLGYCAWEYTPTYRGFDSFLGFYLGSQNYFTHDREYKSRDGDEFQNSYDFRLNEAVVKDGYKGVYSTKIFKKRAKEIIAEVKHEKALNAYGKYKPFFMYLSLQSTHAPLQVDERDMRKVKRTLNPARDIYKSMVLSLDKAVGEVEDKLRLSGLYNDTIIIFTTDNGGAISHGASNWPLRGTKGTMFEGGTRAVGFVHSPKWLKKNRYVNQKLVHVTDWMPTLMSLAGYEGDPAKDLGLDGVDQWQAISQDGGTNRTEMVYNLRVDPVQGAIRIGEYKLIFGKTFKKQGWYDTDAIELQCKRLRNDKKLKRQEGKKDKREDKKDKRGRKRFGGLFKKRKGGFSKKRRGGRRIRNGRKRKQKSVKKEKRRRSRSGLKPLDKIWQDWLPRPNKNTQRIIKERMDQCNWDDFVGHSSSSQLRPRGSMEVDIVELLESPLSPYGITGKDEDNEFDDEEEEEEEKSGKKNYDYNTNLATKFTNVAKAMYNVIEDPEERTDLKEVMPAVFEELKLRALFHLKNVVPSDFPEQEDSGHPRNFGGNFSPGWCEPKYT